MAGSLAGTWGLYSGYEFCEADWLPRIVYFTVGAWLVSRILGSGLGMPSAGL